jgi:hypothetical protein
MREALLFRRLDGNNRIARIDQEAQLVALAADARRALFERARRMLINPSGG